MNGVRSGGEQGYRSKDDSLPRITIYDSCFEIEFGFGVEFEFYWDDIDII